MAEPRRISLSRRGLLTALPASLVPIAAAPIAAAAPSTMRVFTVTINGRTFGTVDLDDFRRDERRAKSFDRAFSAVLAGPRRGSK